ncbi:hypothetical protein [Staphylococcus equorum]|uniref:Uncharacterized protein n=1 Tax=Staphylococcus equorum TaxID=246432 RepID=A0AAP7LV68_9STAP|nr:hypothetical protein [Staphylococcus equorum]OEK59088.1 hypothetical protein ASS94_00040 [Staphylococcus equorum]
MTITSYLIGIMLGCVVIIISLIIYLLVIRHKEMNKDVEIDDGNTEVTGDSETSGVTKKTRIKSIVIFIALEILTIAVLFYIGYRILH